MSADGTDHIKPCRACGAWDTHYANCTLDEAGRLRMDVERLDRRYREARAECEALRDLVWVLRDQLRQVMPQPDRPDALCPECGALAAGYCDTCRGDRCAGAVSITEEG